MNGNDHDNDSAVCVISSFFFSFHISSSAFVDLRLLCEVCKEGIKAPTIRHFKVIAHDATDGLTSLFYTHQIKSI